MNTSTAPARILGVLLLVLTVFVHADVITDWNVIAVRTAVRADPFAQARTATIMHIAMFEAVNAIVGDYEPYAQRITAPAGASPDAAAIAAAQRILVVLHPESRSRLDALRARALAGIPNGAGKSNGIAVGRAAADAILALRSNDPVNMGTPHPLVTRPGEWCPTPPDATPAFGAKLREVPPFGIKSAAQFRLEPPPSLDSRRYARDYNEVKRLGDAKYAQRPQNRTDAARFYGVTDTELYYTAASQVSEAQLKTLSENARNFALISIAICDGAIACFDSKYHYNLWRPITAIRAGATDDNPRTEPDLQWQPLIPTPPFPSYPSGHATFGASCRRVLEEVYGSRRHSITLTNPLAPGITRHYTSWKQLADDINESRINGGVHFRFDQEAGAKLGRRVGDYILRHKLRTVRRR